MSAGKSNEGQPWHARNSSNQHIRELGQFVSRLPIAFTMRLSMTSDELLDPGGHARKLHVSLTLHLTSPPSQEY